MIPTCQLKCKDRNERNAERKMTRRIVLGMNSLQLPAGVEARLAKQGWSLVTANGPEAARVVARETRPATVILPAETGVLTCAKLVRELPRTRIVLVGPENSGLARYARFAGAARYITDPVSADEFVEAATGEVLSVAC